MQEIILLTGASGFIGSHVLAELCKQIKQTQRDTIVRIWMRPKSDLLSRVSHDMLTSGIIKYTYGALENEKDVQDFFQTTPNKSYISKVIHCAALGTEREIFYIHFIGGDWGNYDDFYKANYLATKHLIDATLKYVWNNGSNSSRFERFLHVSSVDVYSKDFLPHECDQDTPLDENSEYGYSKTKSMADKYVLQAKKEHNLPVTLLRPGVVYGIGSYSWGTVESRILHKGVGFLVNGCDTAVTGAIHVNDVADAILIAAASPNTIGNTYNLIDENAPTWRDYYNYIADELPAKRPWLVLPYWFLYAIALMFEFVYRFMGWYDDRPLITLFVLYLVGRTQKWPMHRTYKDLNWKPKAIFKERMKEQVEWIRKNNEHLNF